MDHISQHLPANNGNSYSDGRLFTTNDSNSDSNSTGVREQDELVAWAEDLIDPDYRLWFVKRLKAVGRQRFIEAAAAARKYDGNSRQRVFAYLLK